jgi:DNA-dependent RNA polymerase auxiliary subunit epsilon
VEEEEMEEREPRPAREKCTQPILEAVAPKEWAKKARAMLKDIDFELPWTEVIDQWWLREQRLW